MFLLISQCSYLNKHQLKHSYTSQFWSQFKVVAFEDLVLPSTSTSIANSYTATSHLCFFPPISALAENNNTHPYCLKVASANWHIWASCSSRDTDIAVKLSYGVSHKQSGARNRLGEEGKTGTDSQSERRMEMWDKNLIKHTAGAINGIETAVI